MMYTVCVPAHATRGSSRRSTLIPSTFRHINVRPRLSSLHPGSDPPTHPIRPRQIPKQVGSSCALFPISRPPIITLAAARALTSCALRAVLALPKPALRRPRLRVGRAEGSAHHGGRRGQRRRRRGAGGWLRRRRFSGALGASHAPGQRTLFRPRLGVLGAEGLAREHGRRRWQSRR